MKTNNQYEDNNLEYKNKKAPRIKKRLLFSKGFLWGAAIGGILGILFAPDKGENTRKKSKRPQKNMGIKERKPWKNKEKNRAASRNSKRKKR